MIIGSRENVYVSCNFWSYLQITLYLISVVFILVLMYESLHSLYISLIMLCVK